MEINFKYTTKYRRADGSLSWRFTPPDDAKLCLPCKSSCLKLEHIALVFAIFYLLRVY